MTLGLLYLSLLGLGLLYALIAGALGWLADFGGDVDLGGGDIDAGGHLDVGHVSPLSGTVIATFITGFGGGGTIAHYMLEWSRLPSLGFATASGLVLAAAAFVILELLFRQTQAGSEFAVAEAAGREAEVITPIPAGGVGEVAYQVRGQREQAAARTVGGEAVGRGRLVVIEKVIGPTLYVRPRE